MPVQTRARRTLQEAPHRKRAFKIWQYLTTKKNLHGRTVLLIAHRLSTVENADKIVVIAGGRVIQEGVHKDLINQEGLYKQLVKRQMLSGDAPSPSPVKHPRPPSSSTSPISTSTSIRGRKISALPSVQNPVAQSFLGTSLASSYL